MATRLALTCRTEVEVAAPPEAVWRVVSDVTRTGEWSHECRRVEWLDGATSAVRGARFRGANRAALWRWHRISEVIEIEAGRVIAWRTIPTWRFVDSTEWRVTLEPLPSGTRVVQAFHVVRCPRWWEWIVSHVIPPHRDRRAALAADLHRLGEVAAADVAASQRARTPSP